MVFDIFCDWFQGHWNNRTQAYNNPRGQAYVVAVHNRIAHDQFKCIYTRHRERMPYRDIELDVKNNNGEIVLSSVGKVRSELRFNLEGGTFVCNSKNIIDGKTYITQGYLNKEHYHMNDQCFDEKGKLIRGLENGEFYEFLKT